MKCYNCKKEVKKETKSHDKSFCSEECAKDYNLRQASKVNQDLSQLLFG